MEFNGDDTSTASNERGRDRSLAGADVDNQVPARDASSVNESTNPLAVKPVPPPLGGGPGHGAP
jgi:hypothetical protein